MSDNRGGKSKEILIPSDLSGITRLTLALIDDAAQVDQNFESVCKDLIKGVQRGEQIMGLSLLPDLAV